MSSGILQNINFSNAYGSFPFYVNFFFSLSPTGLVPDLSIKKTRCVSFKKLLKKTRRVSYKKLTRRVFLIVSYKTPAVFS
jgi:hypothetical protein